MNWRERGICLLLAVVCAGLVTAGARWQKVEAKAARTQEELAGEVLRFHVLANSDSEEDQQLKLAVRDGILNYIEEALPHAESVDETRDWVRDHLEEIEVESEAIVRKKGFSYPVKAEVTRCRFPDRTYGDVTFPAGVYEALRVEIGEGEGHNWWCVLYPSLCFLDAVHAVTPQEGEEALRQVLDADCYELLTSGAEVKIKWFFFGGLGEN